MGSEKGMRYHSLILPASTAWAIAIWRIGAVFQVEAQLLIFSRVRHVLVQSVAKNHVLSQPFPVLPRLSVTAEYVTNVTNVFMFINKDITHSTLSPVTAQNSFLLILLIQVVRGGSVYLVIEKCFIFTCFWSDNIEKSQLLISQRAN